MSGTEKAIFGDGVGYAAVERARKEIRERHEKGERCIILDEVCYSEDMAVLYCCYPNFLSDKPYGSFTVPDTVKIIGEEAFDGAKMLKEIIIPEGVEVISFGAFHACASLRSIRIPASIIGIGYLAFSASTELTSIDVDVGNKDYSSADGVLFGKNMNDLCYYPSGKRNGVYRIPDSVDTIWPYAFDRERIRMSVQDTDRDFSEVRVIVPDNVTKLCDYSFNRNFRYIIVCNEGSSAYDYAMKWGIRYEIA